MLLLSVKLRRSQESLDELGTGVPVQPQERVQLMWAMITDYCEVFRNAIRGKFDKKIQAHFDYVRRASLIAPPICMYVIIGRTNSRISRAALTYVLSSTNFFKIMSAQASLVT